MIRWAVKWRSYNEFAGKTEFFTCDGLNYVLFRTKKEAVQHIKNGYGYISEMRDLRVEPHGWRMPIPVRVKITLTEVNHSKVREGK